MPPEAYDIAVVGGGTAGCFAAATAARDGLDVALLERKSEADGGHIACGDAIKGTSTFPDVIDREHLREESFTNENVQRARFENPKTGENLDIGFGDASGAVVDRKRYGEVLLEEAERAGADIHYGTVVRDIVQNGSITGVTATTRGSVREFEAEVVIDAAGSLSLLQDKADFEGTTFDTNVNYQQFCSAYREIVEVPEPVEWHDTIVFKPAPELGYLWYFPRTPTEINVGLGFQMSKPPVALVEALKRDLRNRPEFDGATVKDKLGAALPTRRPYDSAVAPGYIAVGDAAGHINPCTGGGIPGAAKAGAWAAEVAADAIADGDTSERALWAYNRRVQTDFGKRFAAMDLYNIWGGTHDVDELVDIVSAMPGQQLVDALGAEGTTSMSWPLKLRTAFGTFGYWGTLFELKRLNGLAGKLKTVYDDYPATPDGFEEWKARRDDVMESVYNVTGAEPKY